MIIIFTFEVNGWLVLLLQAYATDTALHAPYCLAPACPGPASGLSLLLLQADAVAWAVPLRAC